MYNPQKYANNLKPVIEITKKVFQKNRELLKWHQEPESIMDLGIGDGSMTKEVIFPIVPKNIKEYVGVDISATMLESAEKMLNNEKFKTFVMDAQTKTVPQEMKNRFHHVFSNLLLHHTRDTRQVLSNVKEMLKPGGQFMFNAFAEVFHDEMYENLDKGKWKKYDNWKAISAFYKHENIPGEYENVAKSLGFVNCRIYSEKFLYQLDVKGAEELLVSVNIRLPFVEEADKEEYVRDYLKEMRRTKMMKIIIDEKTQEEILSADVYVVTGLIEKPL